MAYIIFSIDEVNDVHTLAKFLRHMDTQKALGKMEGAMRILMGSYKGVMEQSFICTEGDFNNHVSPMGFTTNQESVLRLYETSNGRTAPRSFADLIYNSDDTDSLGEFKEVSRELAMTLDRWTYDPMMDTYYAAGDW